MISYPIWIDVIVFRTKIDDILVKEMIFENKGGIAGKKLSESNYLIKGEVKDADNRMHTS